MNNALGTAPLTNNAINIIGQIYMRFVVLDECLELPGSIKHRAKIRICPREISKFHFIRTFLNSMIITLCDGLMVFLTFVIL